MRASAPVPPRLLPGCRRSAADGAGEVSHEVRRRGLFRSSQSVTDPPKPERNADTPARPQANKPAPTASPRPHPPSEQRSQCPSTARPSEPWNPDNREAPSPGPHPTSGTKSHPEQPIASHQSPQPKRGAGGKPSPPQGKFKRQHETEWV